MAFLPTRLCALLSSVVLSGCLAAYADPEGLRKSAPTSNEILPGVPFEGGEVAEIYTSSMSHWLVRQGDDTILWYGGDQEDDPIFSCTLHVVNIHWSPADLDVSRALVCKGLRPEKDPSKGPLSLIVPYGVKNNRIWHLTFAEGADISKSGLLVEKSFWGRPLLEETIKNNEENYEAETTDIFMENPLHKSIRDDGVKKCALPPSKSVVWSDRPPLSETPYDGETYPDQCPQEKQKKSVASLPPAGFTTGGSSPRETTKTKSREDAKPSRPIQPPASNSLAPERDNYAGIKEAIVSELGGRSAAADQVARGCDRLDSGNPLDALGCLATGLGANSGSAMGMKVGDIVVMGCSDASGRFGAGYVSCRWRGNFSSKTDNPLVGILTGVASLETKDSLFKKISSGWDYVGLLR